MRKRLHTHKSHRVAVAACRTFMAFPVTNAIRSGWKDAEGGGSLPGVGGGAAPAVPPPPTAAAAALLLAPSLGSGRAATVQEEAESESAATAATATNRLGSGRTHSALLLLLLPCRIRSVLSYFFLGSSSRSMGACHWSINILANPHP